MHRVPFKLKCVSSKSRPVPYPATRSAGFSRALQQIWYQNITPIQEHTSRNYMAGTYKILNHSLCPGSELVWTRSLNGWKHDMKLSLIISDANNAITKWHTTHRSQHTTATTRERAQNQRLFRCPVRPSPRGWIIYHVLIGWQVRDHNLIGLCFTRLGRYHTQLKYPHGMSGDSLLVEN